MNRLTRKSENNAIHDYEPTEYGNDLDRIDLLGEYEDLEEQGLLIKLPCKVGDKLYCISPSFTEVEDIYLTEENAFSTIRHMNRIVFLTREEAEKALEEENV